MTEPRRILADHKKRGKTLVPPLLHYFGSLEEVSWVSTIIPEISWLGLIQYQHGHRRGVELITAMARAARGMRSDGSREMSIFAR
jgi:hypothetical protein